MSRENVELVHRIAAAVEQRDVATFLDLADPDVEWHTSLSVISEGGAYHGHDGIRRYVKDLADAFETFAVNLDDVWTLGEVAIAVGRVSYRGKASGVAQTEPFGWTLRFREGRVVYLRAFRDPEAALARVGLSE
jgi:ketosteroid isomerase-like protein